MITFWGWMIFLLLADKLVSSESGALNGYTDIVHFRDKFIAVGSDGRIDCISKSGEGEPIDNSCKDRLNCAFSNDEILIAAGDNGTILYSSDGKNFYRAESGTDENINGITSQNGLIVTGADKGILLISKDGKSWKNFQINAKGNILSLSANKSFFIGVTDSGEIIKSFDGIDWEIKDYNKEYAGYNKFSKFKKIVAAQNTIVIIGEHDDGSPSILYSTLGDVWAEKELIYHNDEGVVSLLAHKPNGITYDDDRDEFILACDHGELFSLSSCQKCNKYTKISENNLYALIYDDSYLLIVGDEYSVFIQRL
jgi:hypothetical protein